MKNLAPLLLASLLALAPSTAAAYCASVTGLAPGIASPSGIELPKDGGIVVGAFGEDVPLPIGDPAVQPNWRMKSGDVRARPKIVTLAPGLVVYQSTARSGRIDLENDSKESIAWVNATNRARPVLDAPEARTAEVFAASGFTHIDVELVAEAPKDAIAIVLTDKDGTPRSWGLVRRKMKTQQAFAHNRCQVVPNGSTLSQSGEQIRFFWVDNAGRPSKLSKVVSLRGKPNVPGLP